MEHNAWQKGVIIRTLENLRIAPIILEHLADMSLLRGCLLAAGALGVRGLRVLRYQALLPNNF
jgi:hypothetical protein